MRVRPSHLRLVGFGLPILLLIVLTSACAPAIELRNPNYLQDQSVVTGEPCGAPCWRGLIPGESDWGDAIVTLQDDTTLSGVEERADENTGEVAVSFQQKDSETPCCLLYSRDGETVDQILLQIAPDQVTVGEVITTHGDPTYVTGNEVDGEQAALALYYPTQRMVIYVFIPGKETGTFNADSQVFAVLYVRADDMDAVIEGSPLYLWEGYQPYNDYIDEQYDITPVPSNTPGGTDEASATDEAAPTEEAVATEEAGN